MLQSRHDRYGGPYYRYVCPVCDTDNLCERTAKGTFFASPPFSPTVIDWLLGKLAPASAETFLRIAAWESRELEKRRYVFERDGDFRYSSWLERIKWYFRTREVQWERWEEPRRRAGRTRAEPKRPIPSPYRILGLTPGASPDEVKRTFLRLARQHHPDKVHHLGPEEVSRAERRFKELIAAYEKLVGE